MSLRSPRTAAVLVIAIAVATIPVLVLAASGTVFSLSPVDGAPACTPPECDCPRSTLPTIDPWPAPLPHAPALHVATYDATSAYDMPKNDMPKNGLAPAALRENRDLLAYLVDHPLSLHLLEGPVGELVGQSWTAPPLVEHIVSCALGGYAAIELPSVGGATPVYRALRHEYDGLLTGRLGYCPEWRLRKPGSACLERVTACVLARVNATGSSVALSLRDRHWEPLPRVRVETSFRERHGVPIESFKSCEHVCLRGHPLHRNCDWEPRFVGQCERGQEVKLELTRPDAPTRVRICTGTYGCDSYVPGAGDQTLDIPPEYGGRMVETARLGGTDAHALTFICGAKQPGAGARGYTTLRFSVMLASATDQPLPFGADLTPTASPGGTRYPASEEDVFAFREGTFYGSLFEVPGPRDELWVCHSNTWTAEAAMRSHRLCAGSTAQEPDGCFRNPSGPCERDPVRGWPGRCDYARGGSRAGMGVDKRPSWIATACASRAPSWPTARRFAHPITTYLEHPCDSFDDDEQCRRALDPNNERKLPDRWTPDVLGMPPRR